MPKLTIYIPDGLAERLRDAKDLNVSAVCQEALQEEVRRMSRRKEATSEIEAVAARLRETVSEDEQNDYEHGFELGKAWARDWATLRELEGVAELRHESWFAWRPDDEHSLRGFLSEMDDVEGNWHGGGDWSRDPFLNGICDGAGAVYDAAEPLVWKNEESNA